MLRFIQRYKWWLVLAVLVILNIIRYWPAKHVSNNTAMQFPPPMGAAALQAMDENIQARIDALPDGERSAAEARFEQDKAFFASLQSLPPIERMAKVMSHFADDPPPPGLYPQRTPGGPPPGGNGGFNGSQGNGGAPPILPPDARYPFEQAMVNGMKAAGIQ